MERPRGLEPPPTAWQAVVLPLYYGRSEQPIYSMGVGRGQDRATHPASALGTSSTRDLLRIAHAPKRANFSEPDALARNAPPAISSGGSRSGLRGRDRGR